MLKKYFIFFVISIVIYFSHAIFTSQGLFGDGNGYYTYTQSIFFDHKINSTKVDDYLSNFQGKKYIFSRIFWNPKVNPYTIGTGILWLPGVSIVSLFNIPRFDLTYELACGITGILFMIFGLYFLEKYLLNFYNSKVVIWTIVLIFFASNVLYYTAFEPALSHQPSFFIICFLLNHTYKFKKTEINLLFTGFVFGFLTIVRPVDTILLIPILFQIKPKFKELVSIGFGALIGITPQILNQYLTFGNVLVNPYLNGANGTWQINSARLPEYLFSPRRGLFLWTPLFLVSVWGLVKSKSWLFIITISILWLITSSWSAYLSAGFGQRLSFSAIPFLAFGLAYVLSKTNLRKVMPVLFICMIWNFMLIKNVYIHKDIFIQSDNFTIIQFIKYMLAW